MPVSLYCHLGQTKRKIISSSFSSFLTPSLSWCFNERLAVARSLRDGQARWWADESVGVSEKKLQFSHLPYSFVQFERTGQGFHSGKWGVDWVASEFFLREGPGFTYVNTVLPWYFLTTWKSLLLRKQSSHDFVRFGLFLNMRSED